MIAEPLRPEHILSVHLQPMQMTSAGLLTPEYAQLLCSSTQIGWTLVEDGVVLGCGGLVECWENRAQAWTLISEPLLERFRTAHRMVRAKLAEAPWRRIEMDVDTEHKAAIAWAEHLGFVAEGVRRKYTVDGRDMILFARVR